MNNYLPPRAFKNIVVLSVYDSAYCATFMENGKIHDLDAPLCREWYIKKIGTNPEQTQMGDLMKIYPEGTILIICNDGGIETNITPRKLFKNSNPEEPI